jgi:hypothetical protein
VSVGEGNVVVGLVGDDAVIPSESALRVDGSFQTGALVAGALELAEDDTIV